jgi:general L-amino acid transport system permease protein
MSVRTRDVLIQAIALLVVAALLIFLGFNLAQNLKRLGIVGGFGFLSGPSGFDVSFGLFPFSARSSYLAAFLLGLANTVLVSVLGIVLCTLIGIVAGVARWSEIPVISDLGAIYVEIFRNVPLLLQLFVWYFGVLRTLPAPRQTIELGGILFLNNRGLYLPQPGFEPPASLLAGSAVLAFCVGLIALARLRRVRLAHGRWPSWRWVVVALLVAAIALMIAAFATAGWQLPRRTGFGLRGGIEIVPELAALTLALSLYFGAYVAENVRTGLAAVSRGQVEAGRSLGLSFLQMLRLVLLPQALRAIIPPQTGIYLTLIKASALGSAIAYPELIQIASTSLNQTSLALEISSIIVAAYLTLNVTVSAAMSLLERRYRLPAR